MQEKLEKLCTIQLGLDRNLNPGGLKVIYCLLLSSFLCIQISEGGLITGPFLNLPSNAASAAYYVFVAKHNGKEEIF